jgi:large subunit ribosomal protein L30
MNATLVGHCKRIASSTFASARNGSRLVQTSSTSSQTLLSTVAEPKSSCSEPMTHYKITLRRSAIGLPKHIKATLESLGIFRRMQTVFHPHSPEFAGKILTVKELVEVQNVPASAVRTKEEMTRERRPNKGYIVVSRAGQIC